MVRTVSWLRWLIGVGAVLLVATPGMAGPVTAVAAGAFHTCALTSGGGVMCWGLNGNGQLGDGTTTQRLAPVAVIGLSSGVTAVAAGTHHTCAVTSGGGVSCWGDNIYGQLGDGTTTQRLTPVAVSGLSSGVTAVAMGTYHTCAVTSVGGVWCWGYGATGQMGDGTTTERHTPVAVSGLSSGVTAVAAGAYHTCAVTSGGGVWCWGDNGNGQLGDNTTTQRHTPVAVSGLSSGVTAVAAGAYHTCARTSGGGVWCWGLNGNGQLGDGTTTPRLTLGAVSGLSSGVTAITAGYFHTCAVTSGGGLSCWGDNFYGQLGDGTTTDRVTPVTVHFAPSLPSDFNGDGTSDIAVFRPSTGTWYVRNQFTTQFGLPGDIPVPGDYNGNGTSDLAVFRPSTGTWYVQGQVPVQWGLPGDIPVPGDYNGDGTTDVAVFRPSTGTWYVRNQFTLQWGSPGDVPVLGDYNGDHTTDLAVYRPSTGTWYVQNQFIVPWGSPGDIPVPGDYNGDGKTDIAVYRPSTGTWYVQNQFVVQWGSPGDIPVPGDYNGDGITDLAVYRPSTGTWYVQNQFVVPWGSPGDVPVPRDYNGDHLTDLAVYRPSTGTWYVRNQFVVQWGSPGDVAVPGDYNGDGRADLAVYRPSTGTWYVQNQFVVPWGSPGDVAVLGDFNGDGRTDLAVYRPSTGTWYVQNQFVVPWGSPGDIPASRTYARSGRSGGAATRGVGRVGQTYQQETGVSARRVSPQI